MPFMGLLVAYMQDFDWDDVRHFLAVANSGSLSGAADALDVNQSTVSRRIAQFEKRLGTRLFDRSPGAGWSLSLAGEQVLSSAEQMQDTAQQISRDVLKNRTELTGVIKVTCGDGGDQSMIIRTITGFAKQYPQIELSIIVSDQNLDLATREADVAIRVTVNPPSNVVGTRICTLGMGIYGVDSLAEDFAAGRRDLPLVLPSDYGGAEPEWVSQFFTSRAVVHRCNTLPSRIEAATLGLGVVSLPLIVGDRVPGIKRICRYSLAEPMGLWVLSHIDLRSTARVRVFRDYLVEKFGAYAMQIENGFVDEPD